MLKCLIKAMHSLRILRWKNNFKSLLQSMFETCQTLIQALATANVADRTSSTIHFQQHCLCTETRKEPSCVNGHTIIFELNKIQIKVTLPLYTKLSYLRAFWLRRNRHCSIPWIFATSYYCQMLIRLHLQTKSGAVAAESLVRLFSVSAFLSRSSWCCLL